MLRGSLVDIRRAERSDLPLVADWTGDTDVNGGDDGFGQMSPGPVSG